MAACPAGACRRCADIPCAAACDGSRWRCGAGRRSADRSAARLCGGIGGARLSAFPGHNRDAAEFFRVCATLAELGPDRPFYPAHGVRGMTRAAHAAALGLRVLSHCPAPATGQRRNGRPVRRCSGRWGPTSPAKRRSQPGSTCCCRPCPAAAMSAFGRSPAPYRELLAPGTVAVAETYPAEALRHIGIRLKGSKRRQADRAAVADQLAGAMAAWEILPDVGLQQATTDGFGADAAGEGPVRLRSRRAVRAERARRAIGRTPPDLIHGSPLGGLGAGPDRAAGGKRMARLTGHAPRLLSVTGKRLHERQIDKPQEP